MSVASVALANGLNANVLKRWVTAAGQAGSVPVKRQGVVAGGAAAAADGPPGFVAVQMPTPPAASAPPDIYIERTRGPTTIAMRWPAALVGTCASCLRETLK